MKLEIISLNGKLSSLNNVILISNKDIDQIKIDVDNYNKRKDNLENLSSSSKPSINKHGLGYTQGLNKKIILKALNLLRLRYSNLKN